MCAVAVVTHWQLGSSEKVEGAEFHVGNQELGHIHLHGEMHLLLTTVEHSPHRSQTGREASMRSGMGAGSRAVRASAIQSVGPQRQCRQTRPR